MWKQVMPWKSWKWKRQSLSYDAGPLRKKWKMRGSMRYWEKRHDSCDCPNDYGESSRPGWTWRAPSTADRFG